MTDERNTRFFARSDVAKRIDEAIALISRCQANGHGHKATEAIAHYAGRYFSEQERARIKAEVLRRIRKKA